MRRVISLCSRCRERLRRGGHVESLSEVPAKEGRLGTPPPLEGSMRRRGRARSSEWSLGDESARADLDLAALLRVLFIHSATAGSGKACLSRSQRVTVSWASSPRNNSLSLTTKSWAQTERDQEGINLAGQGGDAILT